MPADHSRWCLPGQSNTGSIQLAGRTRIKSPVDTLVARQLLALPQRAPALQHGFRPVLGVRPRRCVILRIAQRQEIAATDQRQCNLVPANNKPFSRLAAFRIIADRLSKNVALEPPALDPKVAEAAKQFLGIRVPSDNHRGH